MINFFLYCIKKMSFWGSPKGAPTTCVVELWKNNMLQWTPTELGGVPGKWMNMFTGDLDSMYVILKGIGSLSCIRVYIIYVNSLWGAATLDVWSS